MQDISAHNGEGSLFLECFEGISPTDSTRRTIHVMFVGKQHAQEPNEPKVCDWNHLSVSVVVPATPTSRGDRGLELTQSYFAAQTKTCEYDSQICTKVTSALAVS